MTQDEDFKKWWFNEGSQPPYTHHDCEEHTMRMCEIAWANGAYKEREAYEHDMEVLMNALWKACGDDEEVVNATIESQGTLTRARKQA
jgi:hypothetical protein